MDNLAAVQTLIPSPIIKKIIVLRCSSGDQVTVIVRERSLTINNRTTHLGFTIRAVTTLPVGRCEDFLVLSAASGWVLIAKIYSNGASPRIFNKIKLGTGIKDGIEGLGHDVQTDFEGRAIAVTSLQNRIMLYSVTNKDALEGEIQISDQFMIKGDMVVLFSCFLNEPRRPNSSTSHGHIFYFILYASAGAKLKLAMYEWQAMASVKSTTLYACLPLPAEIRTPLFFIPVMVEIGGAVIVTEDRLFLVRATDAVNGNVALDRCELDAYPLGFYRDPFHACDGNQDTFLLLCEPFIIYSVTIDSAGITVQNFINVEGCYPGNCFTVQSYDGEQVTKQGMLDSDRTLITYGGDDSPGGWLEAQYNHISGEWETPVFDYTIWNEDDPRHELDYQSYDNWSPVSDFQLIDTAHGKQLYVCCGSGNQGALQLLQHGVKASDVVNLDPIDVEAITSLFFIKNEDKMYFITSFASRSMSCFYEYEADDITTLDQEPNEILAIGFVPNCYDTVVFVTRNGLVKRIVEEQDRREEFVESVTHAAILDEYVLVSSAAEPTLTKIILYRISNEDAWLEEVQVWDTTDTVSFVSLQRVDGEVTAFIGFYTLKIMSASILYPQLVCVLHEPLQDFVDGFPNCLEVCGDYYVVGLRSGQLLVLSRDFKLVKSHTLGSRPVRSLITLSSRRKKLLALSERLMMIDLESPESPDGGQLHAVIPSSELQQNFNTIALLETEPQVLVLMVLNNTMRISKLETDEQRIVARRVTPLPDTPKRLVYLRYLDIWVVALRNAELNLAFYNPRSSKPAVRDAIPHYFYKDKTRGGEKRKKPLFDANESVTSICEWVVDDGNGKYIYLAVATQIGYVRVLRFKKEEKSSRFEIWKQREWRDKGAVTAIAPFGNTLIYAISNNDQHQLGARGLEYCQEDGKYRFFDSIYSDAISSMITQITTNPNGEICVTTLENSIMMFNLDLEAKTITTTEGDLFAKTSICHCTLGDDGNILVFDRARRMSHLTRRQPSSSSSVTSAATTMDTVYNAILPSIIVKAQVIDYGKLWEFGDGHDQAVLACGFDGSFYAFKLLTERDKQVEIMDEEVDGDDDDELVDSVAWTDMDPVPKLVQCDLLAKHGREAYQIAPPLNI